MLLREISLRCRSAEQCTGLGLVVGDRSHGKVSVPQPLRIMFDAQIEASQPQVQPNPAHLVHSGLGEVLRIEAPGWLDRETRSSIAAGLTSQKPAFERVHLLEIDAALEPGEQEQRVARVGSHRSHPAKHGLDMIDRVVALPCALIGALPLLLRHSRVRGGDVIEVVRVQVGVERHAGLYQPAVVLRARQRRETEKLQQVDRQFPFYDFDVALDRCGGVVREAEDVAGIGDDPGRFPGKQHLAVFGDLILAFLRAEEIVGIYVFQSDEYPSHARPRAHFSMKLGSLWQSVSTWMMKPTSSFSASRRWIRRSRIASQSLLRAKLSSVMKKLRMPSA